LKEKNGLETTLLPKIFSNKTNVLSVMPSRSITGLSRASVVGRRETSLKEK